MNKKTFIISLGGSLIAPPAGIDWKFLKKFQKLILNQVKQGKLFYIIAGGGNICREYNAAAGKIIKAPAKELDWLGIYATHLNAYLLRVIFHGAAYQKIIKNPTIHFSTDKKIIIAGGWKPGRSTDYMAVMIAKEYKAKTIINLSNIEYVYDKDPRKYKDARKIENISWIDFQKIIGNKWSPGLNTPFDSVASRKARRLGLKVIIMNGRRIDNLKNCLDNKNFKGTIVE